VLDSSGAEIVRERSSRKEPLSDREARELLKSVRKVVIARGQKSEELEAAKAKTSDLKGPSGNYRAPMLRKGKTLLVGFHREWLEKLL
jgi:hypothetical protein